MTSRTNILAIVSGVVSGILGYLGAEYNSCPEQRKMLPNSLADQIGKTINYFGVLNTFDQSAIEAPIRTIKVNDYIVLYYSTTHLAPLAVVENSDMNPTDGYFVDVSKYVEEDETYSSGSFRQEESLKTKEDQKFLVKRKHYDIFTALKKLGKKQKEIFKYDIGHMAANGNYPITKKLKFRRDTYTYANSVPQHHECNVGLWLKLQKLGRMLVKDKKCAQIKVISGPIYQDNQIQYKTHLHKSENRKILMVDKNGIIIPSYFYKIVQCKQNFQDESYRVSGFVTTADRDKQKGVLHNFETSIDEIQSLTGIKFNTIKKESPGIWAQYLD